ncbi:hypothetical protein CHCC20488_1975 [Bacillus paralicheniformis]|nr:hypothetical protein SC10_B2orf00021 [Bacillus paralicheniformis]OLG00187.1 hypothetical protein B4125_4386 [Bacillus paralicheniformis]TWJ53805.1 hypothetical protein CHCC5023_1353 [Bacillus paralicheniformis]TWJ54173.1 hypothetical protein CHCC5022_0456 [Bacillus paralicheniformis]TWJ68461.1 hypothetical protein CHCC5019_3421 [Bacillus paralicheniformis]
MRIGERCCPNPSLSEMLNSQSRHLRENRYQNEAENRRKTPVFNQGGNARALVPYI